MRAALQTHAAEFPHRLHGLLREQHLTTQRQRHHPCSGGLGDAIDLQRLGATGNVIGTVLAQLHRADMHARPGTQRR